ncbi:Aste57867_21838 [Aphanomyces stellatus]|uniref:Aste57867_21838 protein n=1 Tax=Aphanomyces stellatus TaxID=120398 RepID=A0A485LKN2_9STRA|nr:hypothetical protein As57867_021769 [Aphanomyces stellatus]VFT98507.1 Aste57867_21838 [Aphanomyces stellatus]
MQTTSHAANTRRELPLPRHTVSAVIGVGGSTIKGIQRACRGLRTCRVINSEYVLLEGTATAIAKGVEMVQDIIKSALAKKKARFAWHHFHLLLFDPFATTNLNWVASTTTAQAQIDLIGHRPRSIQAFVYAKGAPTSPRGNQPSERLAYDDVVHLEEHMKQWACAASLQPCRAYLQAAHGILSRHRENIFVRLAIGKTFFEPPTAIQMRGDTDLDVLLQKLPSMRQQFSTSVLSSEHVEAARRWCRENGFHEQATVKKMALFVTDMHTNTQYQVNFFHSDPDMEWETVADLRSLDMTVEWTPARLGIISTHASGENRLEYRLDFKGMRQTTCDVDEDALLEQVAAAWARRKRGCLVLDKDCSMRITSMRYKRKTTWETPFQTVDMSNVTQLWAQHGETAVFSSIQVAHCAMECSTSDDPNEFVEHVLSLASTGQSLVAALNDADDKQ